MALLACIRQSSLTPIAGFHLVGGAGGKLPPQKRSENRPEERDRERERGRGREGYYTQHYLDTVFCYM